MRDLTEKELKLAPDWATHYIVDCGDDVIYESSQLCWWVGLGELLRNFTFDVERNRPIHKPFDMTKSNLNGGYKVGDRRRWFFR